MATTEDIPDDPEEPTLPPLDTVESRWWYLIAAYPIVLFLFIPVIIISVLLFVIPVIVTGPGAQPGSGLVALGAIFGIFLGIILLVMIMLTLALVVALPIALYLDARAVNESSSDWKPDPLLYGLLGALQLIVTPVIGIVVALYYLYRRHEAVGVP